MLTESLAIFLSKENKKRTKVELEEVEGKFLLNFCQNFRAENGSVRMAWQPFLISLVN